MVDADTKEWLTSVYSPNGSDVYAVGSLGTITKSTDGGDTWDQVANGYHSNPDNRLTPLWLEDVFFFNSDFGWCVSGGYYDWSGGEGDPVILKYEITPTGEEWVQINSGRSNECLLSIYFVDADNGWASGNKGTIIYTTDSGDSWDNLTGHSAPAGSPMDY